VTPSRLRRHRFDEGVRLLKVPHDMAEFYDFTEFDELVRAAAAVCRRDS